MKKKIVYIVSDINRAVGFEEISKNLADKFNFEFILLNKGDSYLERYCFENNIPCYRVKYSGKKDLLWATLKTFFILRKTRPDIVHTHLLDASLAGLTAAKLANIRKRIHTRHHSDFHHTYFPHAVKYDRYINRNSEKIVAVSPNVKKILIEKENVPAEKIISVYHGFKPSEFTEVSPERAAALRKKYNPDDKYPVIGVISRYTEWKGVQYIVPAFKEILKEYPNAILILANAQGTYKKEITELLDQLPGNSYTEIVFETDLHALYKLFTVFVHVPVSEVSEAFGQVYIEALLSKVPSVFTRSGIANEFPDDKKICFFTHSRNSRSLQACIAEVLKGGKEISAMVDEGFEYASRNFNLEQQMLAFEKLYNTI